jgi:hypothetical protein
MNRQKEKSPKRHIITVQNVKSALPERHRGGTITGKVFSLRLGGDDGLCYPDATDVCGC